MLMEKLICLIERRCGGIIGSRSNYKIYFLNLKMVRV